MFYHVDLNCDVALCRPHRFKIELTHFIIGTSIMKLQHIALSAALLFSPALYADNKTLDVAIGAGVGAAIGNEVGGRNGAILGGAVGAAIGSADSGDNRHSTHKADTSIRYEVEESRGGHPAGYHCPPGQAKKGRC
jgi:hypothetical protein